MKKILVLCAGLALVASTAFAQGVDVSFTACPGNAGVISDGTMDCVGGVGVTLLATAVAGGALPDLNGAACSWDFQVAGDVGSDAGFWDFAVGNPGALATTTARPTVGCTGYTNTFPTAGSIGGSGGFARSSNHQNIQTSLARGVPLSVLAGAKLFMCNLYLDASTAAEAGGLPAATGCAHAVGMVLNSVNLFGQSGTNDPPQLNSPALFGNCTTINGGTSPMCQAVPAKKHTWGQLKSLYR